MRTTKKMLIRILLILGVILGVAGIITYELVSPTGYYARQHSDLRESIETAQSAYTDLAGETIDLTRFQGKPIVINAWASWSPFSKDELPALAKLQKEFGDAVTIIAMNRNEPASTVQAYRASIADTSGLLFIQDTNDYFFESIGGYAMPETIFYDTTGNIIDRVRGTLTESEFRAKIDQLISNSN